jgi:hypothetical protein
VSHHVIEEGLVPEPISATRKVHEVGGTRRVLEYGLKLPTGEVEWGTCLGGHPIGTEEQRSLMAVILAKTAVECGWPEDSFLSAYRWVPRTVIYDDETSHNLHDPTVAPALPEAT